MMNGRSEGQLGKVHRLVVDMHVVDMLVAGKLEAGRLKVDKPEVDMLLLLDKLKADTPKVYDHHHVQSDMLSVNQSAMWLEGDFFLDLSKNCPMMKSVSLNANRAHLYSCVADKALKVHMVMAHERHHDP